MPASGDHFEVFEDHTLLKHAILRSYLAQWASFHLSKHERTVCFVDGFAGAGRDDAGHPGSPLIAAAAEGYVADRVAARSLANRASMRIAAIEKNSALFSTLRTSLQPYQEARPENYRLLEGEFHDCIEDVVRWTGDAPTLFFVDPFGIGGMPAPTFGPMLGGRKNEEDDWFEYRLEHHPEFRMRVSEARRNVAAGAGVRLEEIERRSPASPGVQWT
jgi:three-Cys-motif partner protein